MTNAVSIQKCIHCGAETTNPKFCSRSCSATYTNKANPKRKITRTCSKCDESVKDYRSYMCQKHFDEHQAAKATNIAEKTLAEYYSSPSVIHLHPSSKAAHVRNFARSWFKHLTKLPCANCGYSLHVELCHIAPIRDFPETAKLNEVNAVDNIIQLCPNCHWELDNGHLDIDSIVSREGFKPPTSSLEGKHSVQLN